eukprot:TRINITY_DN7530_c0_g1_i8.p1 TRINITY_DN7530_c0_g1~~TRINITY_DN7530_c0_g1_i8.p1  ORF type:complete len:252 (+),score=36.95 TRINITY_DN7530_c0_g1_i8:109-864(+)
MGSYYHRSNGSERIFIALNYDNLATLDKVRTTDEVRKLEFLDLTAETEPAPPSPNEEAKVEVASPAHEKKKKTNSTGDTGRSTTKAAPQGPSRLAFHDKVVSELKAAKGGILEIAPKPSLLAYVLEDLTEEERALAFSRELYHIPEHGHRYFEMCGTSGAMCYPEDMLGSDVLFCVRCFAELHLRECSDEVKKKNIERQFKIAVKIHKLTGDLDKYRAICKDCKVPIFKFLNQKVTVCFMCLKTLRGTNTK